MFQTVIDRIVELRRRVDKYRDQLSKNELLTRYVLIDPFLRLLGWDTEDPDQVRPEFSTQAGRPDYALLRGGDRPIAFIGAKSLGKQEDLQQYISYCVSEGVKYFIATDGAKWEIYDTYALRPLPEKKMAEWDITRDEPGEVLRKAFIISRFAAFTGPAPEPIIREPKSRIEEEKMGISLDSFKPRLGAELKYGEIVFPDGQRYSLKRWRDILASSVDWLIKNKKLTKNDCPIKLGEKRFLINTEPVHPNGKRFHSFREVSGLYVELVFSNKDTVRVTRKLLERFGVNPSEVRLA